MLFFTLVFNANNFKFMVHNSEQSSMVKFFSIFNFMLIYLLSQYEQELKIEITLKILKKIHCF